MLLGDEAILNVRKRKSVMREGGEGRERESKDES